MQDKSAYSLVDTHCHLNFDVFDHDREGVLERALINNVTRIVNPGIDMDTSITAIRWAHEFAGVFACIGIHPNSASTWTKETPSELRVLADDHKVVAIGEIGLDYYRHQASREMQILIFREQLILAADLELPVVIHNREAAGDLLDILREWQETLVERGLAIKDNPGVVHSFSGDLAFAAQLTSINFKLGINGPVTFRNSLGLQNVVAKMPLDTLLVETDAPFLTPEPLRGQRNEPANVRIVAEKIAEIQGEPVDLIVKITTAGADRLFRWREKH